MDHHGPLSQKQTFNFDDLLYECMKACNLNTDDKKLSEYSDF